MTATSASVTPSTMPAQPKWLSMLAQVVSYVLHPLFIPFMVVLFVLYRHPVNVLLTDEPIRLRIAAMSFINTVLYPGIFVFLIWRLKFIPSIYLESQRDRIIPLVSCIFFYFWAFYVSRNWEVIPQAVHQWLLGVFLTSSAAMFVNIFMKISLHTLAAGGALSFFIIQTAADPNWPLGALAPVALLAGLVGTSRLIRRAHEPSEIYAGYLAGGICQVAAFYIV